MIIVTHLFLLEHCPAQTVPTSKGLLKWNATSHGRMHLIECPFGAVFHDKESSNKGFAKRRCYLLSNGSVAWGRADTSSCREEVSLYRCNSHSRMFYFISYLRFQIFSLLGPCLLHTKE